MIDNIEALSDQIATQVMGWHLSENGQHWLNDKQDEEASNLTGFRRYPGRWCPECTSFEPYTRMNSAWQVVEKLGLWVFPVKEQWLAGLLLKNSQNWVPHVDTELGVMDFTFNILEHGATAPRAICFAALASLELHTL